MKNLTLPKHHSLTDWDFEPGHDYYLSVAHFVSAPSALAAPLAGAGIHYYYAYLKEDSGGKCIPIGSFRTYFMVIVAGQNLRIFIRQQPPLVHGGDQNGYVVYLDNIFQKWSITRYVNGIGYGYGSHPLDGILANVWNRIRLDFYEYFNPTLDPLLRIELFVELAGEWVSQGYFDSPPAFSLSEFNRIGFSLYGYNAAQYMLADNTEIWSQS